MAMKKVSEWLNELGTHTILDCDAAKTDFKKETGFAAPWHGGYDREAMAKQIEDRGKGGTLSEDESMMFIGSLEVAQACYYEWRGDEEAESKFGMGSQFREYVAALKRNGC